MADIDVSELMEDPDFVDEVQLIVRSSSIGANGRNVVVDGAPIDTVMVVQRPKANVLQMFPDLLLLSGVIQVWYKGVLQTQSLNGYSDIVIWNGKRYQAREIVFDASNWGEGYTTALCALEDVNNRDDANA